MAFVIALLSLFALVYSNECTESNLDYGFSECSNTNTRTAYFYWQTPCTGGTALPRPIGGLDCAKECAPGQWLDIDIAKGKQICSYCPENTYNIGGGDLYTGNRGDWTDYTSYFQTFCYTSNIVQFEQGKNCTSWSSTLDGGKMVTGETTDEAWVENRLVYSANLVKDGILKMQYSKDAQMYDGFMNGELSIVINEDKVYSDTEHTQDLWKEVTLPLQIGQNEIEIVYEKFNGLGCENLNAEIFQIEVRGTRFSAHRCLPCLTGFSKRGSASCDLCGFDQYLKISDTEEEIDNCADCPDGYYARKGSIGFDSCIQKLPCTQNDYTSRLYPCKNGMRTKEYYWAEPQICNEELAPDVILPLSVEIPCEPCNAGFHRKNFDRDESYCVPCPDGTYRGHDDSQTECDECDSGTFALKMLNYTTFSPLPDGFNTSCQTYGKEECYSSNGWIGTEDQINSGYNLEPRVELTIARNYTFTHEGSYVQFVYSLINNDVGSNWMTFEIDGRIHSVVERTQHQAWSPRSYISTGRHLLKWVYIHAESSQDASDFMALHQLIIFGTDEGGASTCESCFSGFTSPPSSVMCEACPAGTMDARNHTECTTWGENTMTQYEGSYGGCTDCPNNTVADTDHASCVSPNVLEFEDSRIINIANITGIKPTAIDSLSGPRTGYNQGICEKDRYSLFCTGTFYGPIPNMSDEDKIPEEFYLSVLNPSEIDLPNHRYFSEIRKGYAFGLVNIRRLELNNGDRGNHADKNCVHDFSRMVVNLGTLVGVVNPTETIDTETNTTETGFTIRYEDGDVCRHDPPREFFTSDIDFVCDKEEGDGLPFLVSEGPCYFQFQWRTKHACPICQEDDMKRVKGSCIKGFRKVSLVAGDECIINGTLTENFEESCSVTRELIKTWIVICGIMGIVLLFMASLTFLFCFCRVKSRYTKLLEQDHNAVPVSDEAEREYL